MSRGIAVTFRCACGTAATTPLPAETASWWNCPTCTRRWQAGICAVRTVHAGARELRCLQKDGTILLVLAAIAIAVLAAIHPPWLLGAPMIVGGIALAARPSYRKRLRHAKAAVRTPITLTRSMT